jgi:hypothetical protein
VEANELLYNTYNICNEKFTAFNDRPVFRYIFHTFQFTDITVIRVHSLL